MSVFADTSALLPLLDADDRDNTVAGRAWEAIVQSGDSVVCSSYVLIETFALVQNRLGMGAVLDLRDKVYPLLTIQWVDEDLHEAGVAALTAAGHRQLSLVDCVSFEVMRRRGIRRVFAFDAHFEAQGFEEVPSAP